MSQHLLYQKVFPEIYKIYDRLLDALYPKGLNTTEKYAYLQQLQEPAKKLHQSYLNPIDQNIEVDYSNTEIQKVYLLRYSIPHALQLPWVLNFLRKNNFYNIDNNITTSFFGCGPCPERLGLNNYLNWLLSDAANIFDARFDIFHNWQLSFFGKNAPRFYSNLVGEGRNFLEPSSVEWVRDSDLVDSPV